MRPDFSSGTASTFARAVSAEIRAQLAAQRTSGKTFAATVGMSQNYLATRLRDEKPFTLDDISVIVDELRPDISASEFIAEANRRHGESIFNDSDALRESIQIRAAERIGAEGDPESGAPSERAPRRSAPA